MKALIWKEWREQRIFLLLAVIILISINMGSIIYLNMPSKTTVDSLSLYRLDTINYYNLFLGWVILPLLFALILGATPFVKEFSNNTQDFLIQRPISTAKIFWLKFFFGIFLLLLIIQLCHLVLYVPASSFKMQISAPDFKSPTPLIMFYLLSLLIYSSTFFSSLLLKRELPAMLSSLLAIVIGILYILPLYLILFIILPPKQLQFLFSGVGDDITVYYVPASILFIGFALFSFVIWQKAISRGLKPAKVFFSITGIIFLIYLVPHTILNFSAGLDLRRAIKEAETSGIKLKIEEIIPPPVPDEENAALVYQEAFNLVGELRKTYKDEWEYMPYESYKVKLEDLTKEQKRTIAKLFFEDTDFIKLYTLIEKAVNLPSCRFDIKYEDGPAMLLPDLNKMRQLAQLVAARTYILTEEKKYKEALESFCVGLRMGESLKNEPTLISQLVRLALDGIVMESLQPIMSIFPEDISINDYQNLIFEIDKKERKITKGLEGELVLYGSFVFGKLSRGNIKDLLSEEFGFRDTLFLRTYASYPLNPVLKRDYAFYLRCLTESISLSHFPYYQVKDKLSELDQNGETSKWKHPLSVLIIPALNRAQNAQARDNAQLDGLKIACALKIYKKNNGYYPDELRTLVPDILAELPLDEFTGENFIYRKQGEGFVVYSVGSNEKDDGGISSKENSTIQNEKKYQDRDNEAYDIVWKCEE